MNANSLLEAPSFRVGSQRFTIDYKGRYENLCIKIREQSRELRQENDPLLLQEWLRDEIEAGTFGWGGAFEITLLFPGGLPYRVMPA
jgi:hypothetical protein